MKHFRLWALAYLAGGLGLVALAGAALSGSALAEVIMFSLGGILLAVLIVGYLLWGRKARSADELYEREKQRSQEAQALHRMVYGDEDPPRR